MLDNVLVIAMSEFGRTPRINGHLGRDHWPEAWSLAMAGCGLQARRRRRQDQRARAPASPSDEHDIGHMFHTWFRALGIDPGQTRIRQRRPAAADRPRGMLPRSTEVLAE